MKALFIILSILAVQIQSLVAGGPGLEIKQATVHEIKKTPLGYALVVSGKVRIGKVEGLEAQKAVVTHPYGSPINNIQDKDRYEKRLKALVGKKILLQVWGDIVTMTGGKITAIHGGVVNTLSPTKEENPHFHVSRIVEPDKLK